MVGRYALILNGAVINVVRWDGNTATFDPAPAVAEPYDPAKHVRPEVPEETTRRVLNERLEAARQGNRDHLAITSPTAAQNSAQVKALTRQMQAVIRLTLASLDGTD